MQFLSNITLFTWIFLASLIITLAVYLFKLDKKIIFYYARKNKRWAVKAALRLGEELKVRMIRDKQKRLNKAIKRALMLAKSRNGRRHYVMEYNNDFDIVDSASTRVWLKDRNYDPKTIMTKECIYYTPVTKLTDKN